jgi:hypothetical protein
MEERILSDSRDKNKPTLAKLAIGAFLSNILVALISICYLKKSLVMPISEINQAIRQRMEPKKLKKRK